MALISCSECGKQISDRAKQCPNCGVPLSLSQVTIEKTSKNVKKLQLIGILILMLNGLLVLFAESHHDKELMKIAIVVFVLLFIFAMFVAFKRWWEHG